MIELTPDQIDEVSAGVGPIAIPLAILGFVYYERQNIRDFVGGVLDGFNQTELMRP